MYSCVQVRDMTFENWKKEKKYFFIKWKYMDEPETQKGYTDQHTDIRQVKIRKRALEFHSWDEN